VTNESVGHSLGSAEGMPAYSSRPPTPSSVSRRRRRSRCPETVCLREAQC